MKFSELHPYTNTDLSGGQVIVFDCPCNDGSRIRLPIGPVADPARKIWSMSGWPGDAVSIHPSVDLRGGGHPCHFNVTSGEVHRAN